MERMLRTTWLLDSSNVKNRQRLPSRQARRAKVAARLVFPHPAAPETRTVPPR